MSGHGGHKHRKMQRHQKKTQNRKKARASVAQARAIFEAKGQAWEPLANPAQMGAMNHAGRRHVQNREHLAK